MRFRRVEMNYLLPLPVEKGISINPEEGKYLRRDQAPVELIPFFRREMVDFIERTILHSKRGARGSQRGRAAIEDNALNAPKCLKCIKFMKNLYKN